MGVEKVFIFMIFIILIDVFYSLIVFFNVNVCEEV